MSRRLHLQWEAKGDIMVLNLDNQFDPFKFWSNVFPLSFERSQFLGGELHLKLIKPTSTPKRLVITQRYSGPEHLIEILVANDAARRMGFTDISLVLPYFPAARQDRVCNEGEALTIKVFADMINRCGFEKVYILTPHSEVTPALINNVEVMDELGYVDQIIASVNLRDLVEAHTYNIVCPDAGAEKRVSKICKHLIARFPNHTFNLIRCGKVRDVATGQLKEFYVQDGDLGGHYTIIMDDINSMGGTFIGLGKLLKERNCGTLALFTVHSDCVVGISNVCGFFDEVYTTNSRPNIDRHGDPKFRCFSIEM